jgi:hypothetical protein
MVTRTQGDIMPIRRNAARPVRIVGALLVGFVSIAIAVGTWALATVPAAAATPTTYYVAMGDSLGVGLSASSGSGYVPVIYQHELARTAGLQLRNFSCSGATTSSVVNSLACGAPVTQLVQAEQFLRAHPGHIAFVTIDIGGNDVAGCGSDATCLQNGLATINTNLPKILNGLKAAYPGVRVFGMNYYDPFLASWLQGDAGQTAAQQSVTSSDTFNALLTNLYTAGGFPTADVGTAFAIDDFSLSGTYNGQTVPVNVANACTWTNMCAFGDFHANNAGHAVIAQTFEPLIDTPAVPGPPTAVTTSPANAGAIVHWSPAAVTGGSPITGYVVTPFVGTAARPAHTFAATATSGAVGGLTNGTTYTFRVAAKNAVGTGTRSAASKPVVAGAPAAPWGVSASASGAGRATVHWNAPANNGAVITGYVVTPYLAGVAQPARTFTTAATTQALTGLATAHVYTFRVAAKNSRGTGPLSAASNAVTIT